MTLTGPTWSPVIPDDPDVVHSAVPGRYYLGCSDVPAINAHLTVLARSYIGSGSNLTPDRRGGGVMAEAEEHLDLSDYEFFNPEPIAIPEGSVLIVVHEGEPMEQYHIGAVGRLDVNGRSMQTVVTEIDGRRVMCRIVDEDGTR